MTPYIALYLRISMSSPDSIEDQEMQGREYCARVWPDVPIVVFAEDGLSGEKEDVIRPQYNKLRAAAKRGEVAQIWCAEQSRLERNKERWFRLVAELTGAGITELHTRREGVVDIDSEVADIRAVLNAREVRKLRERVHDKLATNAARGNAPASLPFGYRRVGKTFEIVPEQAVEVQLAAERMLAGWSTKSIAADMVARGVASARGGKITGSTVKAMLTTPAIAGLRVYRGEVVGKGNWPAILDEATWRSVCAKFAQPRRVLSSNGATFEVTPASLRARPGRKYLLTGGLIACGECKAPLVGSMRVRPPRPGKPQPEPKPYLFCHGEKGGKGCVGAVMEPIDVHVLDRLWAELDKSEFLEQFGGDDHAERRDELVRALSNVDTQRIELAAEWATPGALTMTEWREARAALTEQERTLQRELAALPAPQLDLPNIALVREAWPHMTLDEQREFIRKFIERVVMRRRPKGTSGLRAIEQRIDIEWVVR